jgi:hypothetical protein
MEIPGLNLDLHTSIKSILKRLNTLQEEITD